MKKIIFGLVFIFLLVVTFDIYLNKNNTVTLSNESVDDHTKLISMMLETEASSGTYEVSSLTAWPSDGYIFNSELSKCENGSTLSWNETNKQVVFSGNITDKCYVYFDVYNPPKVLSEVCNDGGVLSSCIIDLSNKSTSIITGIYYHDSSLAGGAGDNSYRYAGSNPNNYVCFGSDDEICPLENLYRIIGVIDGKVKLILADAATTDMLGTDGGYLGDYINSGWDSENYKNNGDLSKIGVYYWCDPEQSTLPLCSTIFTNLTDNFITNLTKKNSKWKTMIDDTTWYLSNMTYANGAEINAKTAYEYDVGINKNIFETFGNKIGMMYLSEYYYAASPDNWKLPGVDKNGSWNDGVWFGNDYSKVKDNNWLYIGLYEWTFSRNSYDAFFIFYGGSISSSGINGNYYIARPTFNLSENVSYVRGTGTISDPIRVV